MEIELNKNEKIIAVITLIVISVFFMLFLLVNNSHKQLSQIETNRNINYQMARPEEDFSEYSLSGREVDRIYDSAQRKEILKTKKLAKDKTDLKKVDLKKNPNTPPKQAVIAAQTSIQDKNQTHTAGSKDFNKLKNVSLDEAAQKTSQYNNITENNIADNRQPQQVVQEPVAKAKKTFAQWRSQIFAQPTRESLAAFIEAYKKNEVSSAEYQAMAQDLLDQDNENLKSLGLVALRAQPSLQSLSQLVHIQASLTATYQAYVEQAYLAYLQPQYVTIFNQAMATSDKILIAKTLQILSANLQKFTQGDYSTLVGIRNKRDGEAVTFSMNVYKVLLTSLSALSSSQDFSSLAQQVTGYIQSTNTVAQN